MENNKVLVLQQNAVIDMQGLDEVINNTLSKIMKYDFTKPIDNDSDNQALKKIIADSRKDWKWINDEKISLKKALLLDYDKVDNLLKEFKTKFDEQLLQGANLSKEYDDNKKLVIENEAREYFRLNNKHTLIQFEQVGLNVTLSLTEKQYKDEIDKFLSRVDTDLQVVATQDNKDRVLSVYFECLDLGQAIKRVQSDIERELLLKQASERSSVANTPTETIKQEVELENETVIKKYRMQLELSDKQVALLKEFMINENIKYDIREMKS